MGSLKEASITQPVRSQYRLMSLEWVLRTDETCYRALVLENADCRMTAELWDEAIYLPDPPVYGYPVEATLSCRQTPMGETLQVDSMRAIEADEVMNGAALLPWSQCPELARSSLSALVRAVDWIQPWPLRQFLNRVLVDPAIGIPYMRSRASQSHHHSYAGGLLVHSIEVARLVSKSPVALPIEDLALGVIGALFHDLGKICTNGEGSQRLLPGYLRHEYYTLQLLGGHLRHLCKQWPRLGHALEYIFQYLATHPAKRDYAKLISAQLIVDADHLNVAVWKGRSFYLFAQSIPDNTEYELTAINA